MALLELSRAEARRLAIRAQWLTAERPVDLVELVRDLTMLQVEPTSYVAPSADVVAWSRLGAAYEPSHLAEALRRRELVELRGEVIPAEDVALHRDEMAHWPTPDRRRPWHDRLERWVSDNEVCRRDLLARLAAGGPLSTGELPDTTVVPWRSTGWTNDQNVARMLDLMVQRGEVAIAGRRGTERLWDLAERVYPDDPVPPWQHARRTRAERQLSALGLTRTKWLADPGVGVAATVDGVRGTWRVDAELLDAARNEQVAGRTALLSPLDRLVFDRDRLADVFSFDYALEMYKPAAQRRWGYWAMPVLHGDRLVGKLDARADRHTGVLRVDAMHWDVDPTRAVRQAVDEEIDALAEWLGLARVDPSALE